MVAENISDLPPITSKRRPLTFCRLKIRCIKHIAVNIAVSRKAVSFPCVLRSHYTTGEQVRDKVMVSRLYFLSSLPSARRGYFAHHE